MKAIRTITAGAGAINAKKHTLEVNGRTQASALLLSNIDESFFYYEPCKAAFNRILTISRKRGRITSFEDLLEDPSLDEEFRDILRESRRKPATSESSAKQLLEGLDKYRKVRSLYFLAKDVIDTVTDSSVDVDALMDNVTNSLTKIRSRDNIGDTIRVMGKNANSKDLIEEALSMVDDKLLKTGYKEFDEKNGGLPSEGVFLIAATTSGGKSVLRMNLMKNLYKLNMIDVLTVSLEMNARKETRRLLSNMTSIPFWKFVKKRLTKEERKQSRRVWRSFNRYGDENGCSYSLLCPTRGVSISQLLMMVKPYHYGVIAIDYISLLDGLSGDDQWRVLNEITREAKIFTEENHCLVILLAQLDSDDDRVRYSKGIAENADNVWIWNYSKQEQRDLHVLPVKQTKARDQELFPFDLRENFTYMQIINMDDEPTVDQSGDGKGDDKTGDDDDPLSKDNINYDEGVG